MQRPGVPLSRADLAQVLRPLGLHGDLCARQMLRVWAAVEAMFAEVGASAGLAQRLVHGPRARSSGPWAWAVLAGDELRLDAQQAPCHPSAGWCFSHRGEADTSLALFAELGQVVSLMWKGLPAEAWRLLDDDSRWEGASAALTALLSLLRGEVLAKQRRFGSAYAALDLAQAQVSAGPPSLAFLLEQIGVQRVRARYAEQPEVVYATLLPEVRALQRSSRGFDPNALADLLNVEALCLRRRLEAAGHLPLGDRMALLAAMERAALASMFGYMAGRQFERAQCACANLAYACQRVAGVTDPAWSGRAMRWYAVSTQMHESLDLSWNSAWEYVFIGELWLGSPSAREAAMAISWQGAHPGELGFYEAGVREADHSADPRQQAHTRLNLYEYARLMQLPAVATGAVQSLWACLDAAPDLLGLLQDEGYQLPPRQSRAECSLAPLPGR